jgi:hypothetical protein
MSCTDHAIWKLLLIRQEGMPRTHAYLKSAARGIHVASFRFRDLNQVYACMLMGYLYQSYAGRDVVP